MRATAHPKKTPNLDKSLRLPLEKLKSASTGRIISCKVKTVNGKRLKRFFMSKVSTNCIREEKVTALKLHEVVCETLQVDIPLRSFRTVLKRYGKDMSSSFEFDDFLEIIRELSRDLARSEGPDGSGDSASCLMRMKNEQQHQAAVQKALLSPVAVKHSAVTKHGDINTNNTERSNGHTTNKHSSPTTPAVKENTVLIKHQSQTAREATSTNKAKYGTCINQLNVPQADLCISLDNISENSINNANKNANKKLDVPLILPIRQSEENLTQVIYSPVGGHMNFTSQSMPPHHFEQSRNIQFTAEAISIKKLEPNLVRLFVSDNSQKAEYVVNTKAVLGKGSFGKVFKGTGGNRPYAIKELTSEFDEFEKNWKRTISRKSVQERLRKCPYIYKIYHIAEERKRRKYWHVFEMVEGISLHKIAHEKKDLVFKDQNLKFWFSQLFSAVHYLNYKLKIVHRDIKTDNVLILQNPSRIKLIDFDHATLWDEPITTSAGAPICLPPEVLMYGQHRYTPAADWWMIGVLLYDVITGRHPFLICKTLSETRGPRRSIDYDLTEENIKAGFKGFSSEHCSRLPGGARSLVHELLTYDPRMRLGFSCHDYECRILKHAFFLDLDWGKIWKWVEVTGPESRMASSGDAKTKSRVSSTESPIREQHAADVYPMPRTPTPKSPFCKTTAGNYVTDTVNHSQPKLNNLLAGDMSRSNSLTYVGQHQKRRSGVNINSTSNNGSGVRWAHTARVSPLTMKSHEANMRHKAQTSRQSHNEKSNGPAAKIEPNARSMKTEKASNASATVSFSPVIKPMLNKATVAQNVTQSSSCQANSKYTTIQPLPCTVVVTNESYVDNNKELKTHQ